MTSRNARRRLVNWLASRAAPRSAGSASTRGPRRRHPRRGRAGRCRIRRLRPRIEEPGGERWGTRPLAGGGRPLTTLRNGARQSAKIGLTQRRLTFHGGPWQGPGRGAVSGAAPSFRAHCAGHGGGDGGGTHVD
jgi:hypothetical protein